jgi:hypothetical protein
MDLRPPMVRVPIEIENTRDKIRALLELSGLLENESTLSLSGSSCFDKLVFDKLTYTN